MSCWFPFVAERMASRMQAAISFCSGVGFSGAQYSWSGSIFIIAVCGGAGLSRRSPMSLGIVYPSGIRFCLGGK